MRKYFAKQIDDAEYELTFMNDYSVEIKGIPRSGFTDEQLIEYLQSFGGKIVEISYARYFKDMLRLNPTQGNVKEVAKKLFQKYPNVS